MGFLDVLKAVGNVIGRPGYAVGNTLEAAGYQAIRPFIDKQREMEIANLIGDTNPLTAGVTEGLTGEDPVGFGTAVRRMNDKFQTPVSGLVDNPITEFGFNVLADPLRGASKLAGPAIKSQGAKLSAASQADDASLATKAAARVFGSGRAGENVAVANAAAGGSPELTLLGAPVVGMARKSPTIDRLISRLYGAGNKVDDVAAQSDEFSGSLLPEIVERPPVVNPPRPAINDLGGGSSPFAAGQQVGEQLALGRGNLAIPQVTGQTARPMGGPQASAMEALNAAPVQAALPTGARAMGMGPIASPGVSGEARMQALRSALGGKGLESIKGNRAAGGQFLNKAVVQDAEQLRELLANPETRMATMKMLMELVS